MITEAIILAGGLGTRLKSAVPDLPKCMAPVAGRPFLFYVINELRMQGIERFIFSLGYKHEVIVEYLEQEFSTLDYTLSIETTPLKTGGAIRLAINKATTSDVLIVNGDTLFRIDLDSLEAVHHTNNSATTLALKPMQNFDRYGLVEMDQNNRITGFKEKQFCESGLINGGVYMLNVESFNRIEWPEKFSFEKEYLEAGKYPFFGSRQEGYFIDIGIPTDYEKAQDDLAVSPPQLGKVDKSWTLFLDRDGVINEDKKDSYIFNPGEFIFTTGAPSLFRKLGEIFGRIIVITNQRGIGRGLMTEEDLTAIHEKMTRQIEAAGGRIDGIYYCTTTNNTDPTRKPNPGMARMAKNDFEGVDLSKTLIVGNNLSDMKFGRNAGIYTVFVKTTRPDQTLPHPDIDLAYDSLEEFAKAL